jgi:hypothetical protein
MIVLFLEEVLREIVGTAALIADKDHGSSLLRLEAE